MNRTTKVLIVDDDVLIAETLKDHLLELGFNMIRMVHNKRDVDAMLELWKPDIALLDIRMEEQYDGLEIGEKLSSQYNIPFMYITAHADMEMTKRILQTKPNGYITKPIRINELMVNLGMVLNELEQKEVNSITLNSGKESFLIKKKEILYFKSEGNYIDVHTDNEKIVVRGTIDQILKDLDDTDFQRIHRSVIVNVKRVLRITQGECKLENGLILAVSRTYAKEISDLVIGNN